MQYWEKELTGRVVRGDGHTFELYNTRLQRWVVVYEELPHLSSDIRFSGNWYEITEDEALAVIEEAKR
ncbi:MAG: hypothetical protein ACRDWY_15985 [Actinomycetes bacterium]